jgi:hypothetical protein
MGVTVRFRLNQSSTARLGGPFGRRVRAACVRVAFAPAHRHPGDKRLGGCGFSSVRSICSNSGFTRGAGSGPSGTLRIVVSRSRAEGGCPRRLYSLGESVIGSVDEHGGRRKSLVRNHDGVSGSRARCFPQQVSDACRRLPSRVYRRGYPVVL